MAAVGKKTKKQEDKLGSLWISAGNMVVTCTTVVAIIVKKSGKKQLIISYDSKLIHGGKMMVMWRAK